MQQFYSKQTSEGPDSTMNNRKQAAGSESESSCDSSSGSYSLESSFDANSEDEFYIDDESQIMRDNQPTGPINCAFTYCAQVESDECGQAASKIESTGLSLKKRTS